MIYKPDYTLEVVGGQVHFLFTSLTYKKYCDKKGIELDDFLRIIQKAITPTEKRTSEWVEETKDTPDFKTSDYIEILLSANETYCIYHKTPFTATEAEAYEWIDAMGGLVFSTEKRIEVFRIFISKLLNVDVKAEEVETAPKNGVSPVSALPGGNSLVEH